MQTSGEFYIPWLDEPDEVLLMSRDQIAKAAEKTKLWLALQRDQAKKTQRADTPPLASELSQLPKKA
jgi:hypothetical protein